MRIIKVRTKGNEFHECHSVVEDGGDGTFSSYAANLPGVTGHGGTLAAAERDLLEAFTIALDMYERRGLKPPFDEPQCCHCDTKYWEGYARHIIERLIANQKSSE